MQIAVFGFGVASQRLLQQTVARVANAVARPTQTTSIAHQFSHRTI